MRQRSGPTETAPSPKDQSARPPLSSALWLGAILRSLEKQDPRPSSSSRPSSGPRASRDRISMRQSRPILPMGFRLCRIPRLLSSQWDPPKEVGLHLPREFQVPRASHRSLKGMGANPSLGADLESRGMARGNPDCPPANRPGGGVSRVIKPSPEKTTASLKTIDEQHPLLEVLGVQSYQK